MLRKVKNVLAKHGAVPTIEDISWEDLVSYAYAMHGPWVLCQARLGVGLIPFAPRPMAKADFDAIQKPELPVWIRGDVSVLDKNFIHFQAIWPFGESGIRADWNGPEWWLQDPWLRKRWRVKRTAIGNLVRKQLTGQFLAYRGEE